MLPEPLHPAVVHFPIVLVVLLPLFAVGALWAIRHGSSRIRAWALPVLVAAALVGSSWVALETGEAQEDTVEAVVAEEAIHTHEERAEVFLLLSIGVLALAGLGFAGGRVGRGARIVSAVAAAGLIVAGARVGASGGDLVYRHGAAQAYVSGGGPAGDDTQVLGSVETDGSDPRGDTGGDKSEGHGTPDQDR